MKLSSKELKRIARGNLTDHYNIVMKAFISVMFLSLLIDLPFSTLLRPEHPTMMQNILYCIAEFLISIIVGILQIGLISLHLSLARGQELAPQQIFCCFRAQTDRYIINIICKTLLYGICASPALFGFYLTGANPSTQNIIYAILLCAITAICILFVNVSFYLTSYLLLDHEELSVRDSFQKSFKLMKGHKLHLICLYFSFIGMGILEILSIGIGAFWIEPYKSQTFANFYLNITEKPTSSHSTFQTYV